MTTRPKGIVLNISALTDKSNLYFLMSIIFLGFFLSDKTLHRDEQGILKLCSKTKVLYFFLMLPLQFRKHVSLPGMSGI